MLNRSPLVLSVPLLLATGLTAAILPAGAASGHARTWGWSAPPDISIADSETAKAAGALDFQLTLSEPARWNVRGVVRLRSKTGILRRSRAAFFIRAGASSTHISVPIVDDARMESDGRVTAEIHDALGARLARSRAIGVIRDDENDGLSLTLLHINDHHSHLMPDRARVDLGTSGGALEYGLGGFPQVAAAIKALQAAREHVVKIHAGDAITGSLYYSLFKGKADAALMNTVCFDIFELGNHELDDSDAGLRRFLDWLNAGRCGTATLGANVIPAVGSPLAPSSAEDYIRPYVVKTFGNQRVGFIGIDIAHKTKVSSSPLPTTAFLDETATARRYVAELQSRGIENIVLVTHQQYENDLALARRLPGVDAIVGGDSHTLLGDFGPFDLPSAGPYPTLARNADGDPVCVAQAWQYAAVVGELQLRLVDGRVRECGGAPHLLVSDLTRDGEPLTQHERSEASAAIDAIPTVSLVTPDPAAERLLQSFSSKVDALQAQVIGTAAENLCLQRIPGDGQSTICRPDAVAASGATLSANGGFIQQIVTDAFKARAFRADFALQNAGGARIDLPAGGISIADAYRLLPFANTLVELRLTGSEVVRVLEDAVANILDQAGGSTGSYPYGSGIRWNVDLSQPRGSRFSSIEAREADGRWTPIELNRGYVVVTNSFLAAGRDGYDTFAAASQDGRAVDTFIDYTQSFIDWVQDDAGGVLSVPSPAAFSTQHFER